MSHGDVEIPGTTHGNLEPNTPGVGPESGKLTSTQKHDKMLENPSIWMVFSRKPCGKPYGKHGGKYPRIFGGFQFES